MVVSFCDQWPTLEPCLPEPLSLYGSWLTLAKNGIYTRLENWKWSRSHTVWRWSWLDAMRDRQTIVSCFSLTLVCVQLFVPTSALLTNLQQPQIDQQSRGKSLPLTSPPALPCHPAPAGCASSPYSPVNSYLSIWDSSASAGLIFQFPLQILTSSASHTIVLFP